MQSSHSRHLTLLGSLLFLNAVNKIKDLLQLEDSVRDRLYESLIGGRFGISQATRRAQSWENFAKGIQTYSTGANYMFDISEILPVTSDEALHCNSLINFF